MKQFRTIEKLDTGILYALELASSISILLLAFGLIASMANVLTKGAILTDNIIMQRIWAVTQCCGIDASLAGTIMRTFQYHQEGEKVKTWLYAILSFLLLFTAAIVLNIESVQQTLNLTLNAAYIHVFVPIEALIWIRSLAIVLLIVAHALRHAQIGKPQVSEQPGQPRQLIITPELLDSLRELLARTTVSEDANKEQLLLTEGEQTANKATDATREDEDEQGTTNRERVKAYMLLHPEAKVREVAEALTISTSTANKWMSRAKG